MGKKRRRTAKKAAKLNDLLIRWGRLRVELDAIEADTPKRFLAGNDVRHYFEKVRHAIEDTQMPIAHAYGAAAAHAAS